MKFTETASVWNGKKERLKEELTLRLVNRRLGRFDRFESYNEYIRFIQKFKFGMARDGK